MTSHYSDPTWRAVEADRLMERGQALMLLPVLVMAPQYDGYGGCGDGGYASGGCGDSGGGDGGDGGDGGYSSALTQETNMHTGLAIVTTPGGSYPYVRIGWLSHREGDVWELRNCRVIKRFGSSQSVAGLASKGPAKTTELLDASPVELVHALHMIRVIPADPNAWAKECPKPSALCDASGALDEVR